MSAAVADSGVRFGVGGYGRSNYLFTAARRQCGRAGAGFASNPTPVLVDGLVVEVGRGTSTGGKPPTPLQLNPQARSSVGVLSERNICVVVITDLGGRPVARTSFHGTELLPPERALPLVASRVEALVGTVGVERDKVLGVGQLRETCAGRKLGHRADHSVLALVSLEEVIFDGRGCVGRPPRLSSQRGSTGDVQQFAPMKAESLRPVRDEKRAAQVAAHGVSS